MTLDNVREYGEGYGVELVCSRETKFRLSVRAKNEGGNNDTLVDLYDLLDWLRFGPRSQRELNGFYLPITGVERK